MNQGTANILAIRDSPDIGTLSYALFLPTSLSIHCDTLSVRGDQVNPSIHALCAENNISTLLMNAIGMENYCTHLPPHISPIPIQYASLSTSKDANDVILALRSTEYGDREILVGDDNTRLALSALLLHCQATHLIHPTDRQDGYLWIQSITIGTPLTLQIDDHTYAALQIFRSEMHPSAHGLGKAKEGVSLFALLSSFTNTTRGKSTLKNWMKHPLTNMHTILQRQDTISWLLSSEGLDSLAFLSDHLKSIRDVHGIVQRIRAINATASDWVHLAHSLQGILAIHMHIQHKHPLPPFLQAFRYTFSSQAIEECQRISSLIHNLIDFKGYKEKRRMCIKLGADETIDSLRAKEDALEDKLTAICREEYARWEARVGPLHQIHVVYYPQLGYHVVISREEHNRLLEEVGAERLEAWGMDVRFSIGTELFVKSPRMVELDESPEFGDVWGDLVDAEQAYARAIEAKVVYMAPLLASISTQLGTMDVFCAMATCAKTYHWNKPTMHESGESPLLLSNIFHPLGVLTCEGDVIRNSLQFKAEKVAILSGSNGSGKSFLLKTVALTIYLAHLGSFTPSDMGTHIPLFDHILARMYTNDDVWAPTSTLASDIDQVVHTLHHATSSSLVLLDEYGRGTQTHIGGALLATALLSFTEGNHQPYVLATTHLAPILKESDVLLQAPIQWLAMKHVELPSSPCYPSFTYKCERGVTMKSHGITVAAKAGLPDRVIQRARDIYEALEDSLPIPEPRMETTIIPKKYQQLLDHFYAWDGESIPSFINSS